MGIEQMKTYSDELADNVMADLAATAMKKKLKQKREEGRGGWHTDGCSIGYLKKLMREHIDKGDMVDVLNFAGMIMVKEQIKEAESAL
jgi:hypothetical protein